MLARHPDGRSAGKFFDEARAAGKVIPTDLAIFRRALEAQQALNVSASINLNAETIFSSEFLQELDSVYALYPDFDADKVCLEITEQGGIPKNYNPQTLLLLKNYGFRLALDDYNPFIVEEQARLEAFVPYVDYIKFPHEVMAKIRSGDEGCAVIMARVTNEIKRKFPHITLVMEGFRKADSNMRQTLKEMGMDIVQNSSYGELDAAPS